MTDPLRYGRSRLDGDLDEFHRAITFLELATCHRSRFDPGCDPATGSKCQRHERQAARRRLRAVPDQEAS